MANYGIMHTYNVDTPDAALLRNLCEPGVEALEESFPNQPSEYYFDMCIQYDGGGLLGFTRVYMENRHDEGASVSISTQGSPPAGAIGDTLWLPPNSTNTGHAAIPMKRISMSQRIEDGQVVWGVDGYQVDSWQTGGQSGFYNSSNANADVTIFYSTVPVTFNYGDVWVFQTYHDTPLLNYSPPQSFLDGLDKESDYYISYYMGRVDGDTTASNAQRIYFKKDPGTIHVRTCPTGSNTGWYISWDNADETDQAWNYNLSNSNGTSDDWSFTGGSGGWAHDMYEYDSTRDPHNGYRVIQPYWLFIFESSVPINYGGVEIEPSIEPTPPGPVVDGIGFVFTKSSPPVGTIASDYMLINVGTYVANNTCTFYPSDENILDPIFQQPSIIPCFATGCYSPHLKWTSPRTNESYDIQVSDLTELTGYNPVYKLESEQLTLSDYRYLYRAALGIRVFDRTNSANQHRAVIRGMRFPYGERHTKGDWTLIDGSDYDNWIDQRAIEQFSLGQLYDYMNLTDPGFQPDDLYTVIECHFIDDYDITAKVLELDYSSLYGSGVDPHGAPAEEGTSWDPLPGHENDSTDPDKNPGQTNDIPLVVPTLTPYDLFNRTFILNAIELQKFGDLITSSDDSIIEAILEGLQMFGANPMASVIDLRLYPFDVFEAINHAAYTRFITFGRYPSNVLGQEMRYNANCILDLGEYYIKPKYQSFLDYEPYTMIKLYIPYIGTVDLVPSIVMGRTIAVRIVVDFLTGIGTAVVYCEGIPILYKQGTIGTSITVTGDDVSKNAYETVGGTFKTIGKLLGGIAGGTDNSGSAAAGSKSSGFGKAGVVFNAIGNTVDDIYQMGSNFNNIDYETGGFTNSANANWLPQKCHIMIYRPKTVLSPNSNEMAEYGKGVGYATLYPSILSNLDGNGIYYATLPRHTASVSGEPKATETEIKMMQQVLANGFYVQ